MLSLLPRRKMAATSAVKASSAAASAAAAAALAKVGDAYGGSGQPSAIRKLVGLGGCGCQGSMAGAAASLLAASDHQPLPPLPLALALPLDVRTAAARAPGLAICGRRQHDTTSLSSQGFPS